MAVVPEISPVEVVWAMSPLLVKLIVGAEILPAISMLGAISVRLFAVIDEIFTAVSSFRFTVELVPLAATDKFAA